MNNSLTHRFFEGIEPNLRIGSKQYEEAKKGLHTIDTFSVLCHDSFYVLDFHRKNFFYVSPNPLFLCGYPPHVAKEDGYEFYEKIVHPDDLDPLIHIHHVVLDYFYQLPVPLRDLGFISFNFHILYKGMTLMVNQKVNPLELTKDGRIWLAGCVVSHSFEKEPCKLFVHLNHQSARHHYSSENQKWEPRQIPQLSERDQKIILLAAQNKSNEEIARQLHLSVSTIKNIKNEIFKQLGTNNIQQAVSIALNYRLI